MKMRIKNIIAAFIWRSGVGPLLRVFLEPRLLAIAYHNIADTPNALTIFPKQLSKHIAYLKRRGYTFATFHELANNTDNAIKKAAIYFDDGFRDIPLFAIPATFFLATDYLDQKNGDGYLTWQEARILLSRGEIGSHSVSHRKLTKMPLAEARQELTLSKQLLEERLGIEVTSFSYPKGRGSPELEKIAHEIGYTLTTAGTQFRKIRPDPNESLAIFKLKLLGVL